MQKTLTKTKTGVKTVIAVALVFLAVGPVVAGWYYYGSNTEHTASFWKKNASVVEKESKSTTSGKSQTGNYMGKVLGACQMCGGKTYCKCECPKKK